MYNAKAAGTPCTRDIRGARLDRRFYTKRQTAIQDLTPLKSFILHRSDGRGGEVSPSARRNDMQDYFTLITALGCLRYTRLTAEMAARLRGTGLHCVLRTPGMPTMSATSTPTATSTTIGRRTVTTAFAPLSNHAGKRIRAGTFRARRGKEFRSRRGGKRNTYPVRVLPR